MKTQRMKPNEDLAIKRLNHQINVMLEVICNDYTLRKDLGPAIILDIEIAHPLVDVILGFYGFADENCYKHIKTGAISAGLDEIRPFVFGKFWHGEGEVSVKAIRERLNLLPSVFRTTDCYYDREVVDSSDCP